MRRDMQTVQANVEAWRQEDIRNNGNGHNGGQGGNGARRVDVLSLNKFVDLVPKFEPVPGKPLGAQMWIEEIEKTFSALEIPEFKKVEYASYMLTGRANDWWSSTRRHMTGAITWQVFQQAFFREFFPDSLKQKMLQEYYTLQQGKLTVEEYGAELHRLMRFLPDALKESEEAKVSRFITGLEPEIQYQVNLMDLNSYSAVVNKAKTVEQGLSRIKSREPQRSQIYLGKRPATGSVTQDKGKRPFVQPFKSITQSLDKRCPRCFGPHDLKDCKWTENACFSCGKLGHKSSVCTEKVIPQVFCFKCGQRGHRAVDCKGGQFSRVSYGQGQRAPAKVYALQRKETASIDTIAGMFPILQHSAFVLFDTGASFSCISESFMTECDLSAEYMNDSMSVST